MTDLHIIGVNHTCAPIEFREILKKKWPSILEIFTSLKESALVSGFLLITTCNRVEIYFTTHEPEMVQTSFFKFLNVENSHEADFFYRRSGQDAVDHCFSVASGLDSMIPGEPEILGQMKRAFQTAQDTGHLDSFLTFLFEKAFKTAKEVRSTTEIGKGALSIASVALEVAQKVCGTLATKSALVIGGGHTGETLIKHLIKAGAQHIALSSRTSSRALYLSAHYGVRMIPAEDWKLALHEFDLVFTATSSPEILIDASMVREIFQKDKKKTTLCLLDLAVPRNIDPEAHHLQKVFLFNVDDFIEIGKSNRRKREDAFLAASQIIEKRSLAFKFSEDLSLRKVIHSLNEWIHATIKQELEAVCTESGLGEQAQKALSIVVYHFEKNLFHQLVTHLKSNKPYSEGCAFLKFLDERQLLAASKPQNTEKPVIEALTFRIKKQLLELNVASF